MTDTQLPNLWTFKTPKPYPGSLRDEQGNALNGFKVQDTKKTRKVSILCNGRYMRHYKFPKDVVAPKHPMIRWLNTPMCGGYGFYDSDGNCIAFKGIDKAVLAGEKPVGDIMFWNSEKEKCELFLEQAKKLGLEIVEQKKPFEDTYKSLLVGVNKPIKELFDLNSIAQFYGEGTRKTEYAEYDEEYFMGYFLEQEMLGQVQDLTPVQTLLTYVWASPKTLGELMLTGLCLGYSFESTLALMLE
jgi:hypothetical protein